MATAGSEREGGSWVGKHCQAGHQLPHSPQGSFCSGLSHDLANRRTGELVPHMDGFQPGSSTETLMDSVQLALPPSFWRGRSRQETENEAMIRACALPDIASGAKTPLPSLWDPEHGRDGLSCSVPGHTVFPSGRKGAPQAGRKD